MVQDKISSLQDSFTSGREDAVSKSIEKVTTRIPSVSFLGLAFGAMAVSIGLELFSRKRDPGAFVGLWVPTLLLFGIYNKLVKVEGSDRFDKLAA